MISRFFSHIFNINLKYNPLIIPFFSGLFQVYYIHDGSEFSTDSIFFEIELSTQGARTSLPVEMQVKQRFQLQISIRPQNDVPKIGMHTY